MIKITNEDLLKYAVENGMLDLSYVQEKINMKQREELLKKHPYKIWFGKDNNWHTYLPTETGRVPKKRREKKDLEDVIVDYWKQQEENPTIKEVFEEWVDRRLELRKISKSSHLRYTQTFNQGYAEFGATRIKSTSAEQIADFLEERACKLNLSAKAFSNLKSITKGMFKRAKKRRLISFNIEEAFMDLDTSELDFKSTYKEDSLEVFDEEEMPIMINYLEHNLDTRNLCILLMFVTGIRIGEAVAIKHENISGNTIKIKQTETRYRGEDGRYIYELKDAPKTIAGFRTVVIPDNYKWMMKKIASENPFGEYVFTENGERLHTGTVRWRQARLCEKLGIVPKSPHKIRKTYATILLDNNVDKRMVIGLMGHTQVGTTETHYHRNRKSLESQAKIISSIPDFKI